MKEMLMDTVKLHKVIDVLKNEKVADTDFHYFREDFREMLQERLQSNFDDVKDILDEYEEMTAQMAFLFGLRTGIKLIKQINRI